MESDGQNNDNGYSDNSSFPPKKLKPNFKLVVNACHDDSGDDDEEEFIVADEYDDDNIDMNDDEEDG